MFIKDIIASLETIAPLSFQESYDNAGLQVGSPEKQVEAALICLDVTEDVLDEAIAIGAGLIISHHPVIFGGIKKLTGGSYTERILVQAVRNDLAIYSSHTNLDAVSGGVSTRLGEKLGLKDIRVLAPMEGQLRKLVFFVPPAHSDKVRQAIFKAGAGHIGAYDMCSFGIPGEGTFRGGEDSDPFVGEKGKMHTEAELRIETIYPQFREKGIIRALLAEHPYEEVAYDIYPLENRYEQAGMGIIGSLPEALKEKDFLGLLRKTFGSGVIRHSRLLGKPVGAVAACGGSGSSLLGKAISSGAQAIVSGDFKYHRFFDADGRILIADIGHFESERFTSEVFYEHLKENFPTFALHLSEQNTNPVNYY